MKLLTKSFVPVGEAIWLHYEAPKSNIILPHNAKLPPFFECEVLEVGPEVKEVKKGDRVIVNSVAITTIKLDGTDYFFTKQAQVVAVVRGLE